MAKMKEIMIDIESMHVSGYSAEQIAKEVGISIESVKAAIQDFEDEIIGVAFSQHSE
jgi:transposase